MLEDTCPLCHTYTSVIPTTIHWIQCTICSVWYHNHCLKLSNSEVKTISEYHCPECYITHGSSKLKRISRRTKRSIDYVALDSGDIHTMTLDQHPHLVEFMNWENPKGSVIKEINGWELKHCTKLDQPVKIPKNKRDGLGMVVPEGFNIDELVKSLGEDHPIEIMDVLTQNGIKGNWTLGSWRDYFKSAKKDRERILNVLSLEISESTIGQSIKRPTYVEIVDLVDKVWPDELTPSKPKVKKYCLMGVEDSYTDFHLDFAGTSVYYTVINGSKQFMFFPPTKLNLRKYTHWTKNLDENKRFLGSLGLEKGIKVNLTTGDSLIIPSGWIHAVYTPQDTIVIGGNFLTSFNIPEQLKIIDIEIDTKVDKKFKFPNFSKLMWFTAYALIEGDVKVENGGVELVEYLKDQVFKLKNGDAKVRRSVKDGIPWKYVGKIDEFMKRLECAVESSVKEEVKSNGKRLNDSDETNIKKKIKQEVTSER